MPFHPGKREIRRSEKHEREGDGSSSSKSKSKKNVLQHFPHILRHSGQRAAAIGGFASLAAALVAENG
jgi:hypothetical protein